MRSCEILSVDLSIDRKFLPVYATSLNDKYYRCFTNPWLSETETQLSCAECRNAFRCRYTYCPSAYKKWHLHSSCRHSLPKTDCSLALNWTHVIRPTPSFVTGTPEITILWSAIEARNSWQRCLRYHLGFLVVTVRPPLGDLSYDWKLELPAGLWLTIIACR